MAEPALASVCCEAPVRDAESGVPGYVCTACELRCLVLRQWNGLPPVGTFEAPLGKPYSMERAWERRRV